MKAIQQTGLIVAMLLLLILATGLGVREDDRGVQASTKTNGNSATVDIGGTLAGSNLPLSMQTGHILGDVDCDLDLTAVDALGILRSTAGMYANAICLGVGDLNCDDHTNAVDALGVLRLVAGLSPIPRPAACTTLSAAIAEETADKLAEGWHIDADGCLGHSLVDVVGSFDSIRQHRVTVYCNDTVGFDAREQVVFYEVQGDELTVIGTFSEAIGGVDGPVHFNLVSSDQLPVLVDINGDDFSEVAVHQFTGGNGWEYFRLRLFTVRSHTVEEVPVVLPATGLLGPDGNRDGTSAVPMSTDDIDGDGINEVITFDASWELHGFCHACSPAALFVLTWNGAEYVNASRDPKYRSFFDERIDEIESTLPPEPSSAVEESHIMSAGISLALLYGHSGRTDKAWQAFDDAVAMLSSDCWKQAAPAYASDLELSVPKTGEAPSTSVPGSDLPFCP